MIAKPVNAQKCSMDIERHGQKRKGPSFISDLLSPRSEKLGFMARG